MKVKHAYTQVDTRSRTTTADLYDSPLTKILLKFKDYSIRINQTASIEDHDLLWNPQSRSSLVDDTEIMDKRLCSSHY